MTASSPPVERGPCWSFNRCFTCVGNPARDGVFGMLEKAGPASRGSALEACREAPAWSPVAHTCAGSRRRESQRSSFLPALLVTDKQPAQGHRAEWVPGLLVPTWSRALWSLKVANKFRTRSAGGEPSLGLGDGGPPSCSPHTPSQPIPAGTHLDSHTQAQAGAGGQERTELGLG